MLVCRFAAAARDYAGTGLAAPWIGNSAPGRHVFADAERRLSVARQRSREDAAGNPKALAAGCGSVRRILEDDDADVPVREAAALDDPARSHYIASERSEAIAFSAAAIP